MKTPVIATLTFAAALLMSVSPARATDGQPGPSTGTGCMAVGQGPTVVVGICRYIAVSDTQNVIAVDGSPWEINVVRCCPNGDPDPSHCASIFGQSGQPPTLSQLQCTGYSSKTFVLMEDDGSSLARIGQVHPIPGEYVTVYMGTGALGFISVGQDEAFVPGGLPLPTVP
jgi:hypothetical protein